MAASDQSTTTGPPPAPARHAARNARHSYLIGRLHSRQITMEEATELFTIMQEELAASEAARLALSRSPASARTVFVPPPETLPRPALSAGGDELLLVGLLAMGAGAGLLAAMTKRIQDVTTPAGATPTSQSSSGSSSD